MPKARCVCTRELRQCWWQDLKVDESNLSRGKLRVSIHVGQDKPVEHNAKKSVLSKLTSHSAPTVGRLKLEAMSDVGFPLHAPCITPSALCARAVAARAFRALLRPTFTARFL